MQLYPTFYFRKLNASITLSHHYQIKLRNPHEKELPIFQQNIQTLCYKLSDKEKKKVLYTLFPLGNIPTQGTLEEQFITELSKIWVIATCGKAIPFEQGMVDYGHLCGFISDGMHMRTPSSFICDITTLTSRELLRALKKELPKAAQQLLNPSVHLPDITELTQQASSWDSILTQPNMVTHCIQIAKFLRSAYDTKDILQKLIFYCIAAEILVVHNPSAGESKMPMNRQFVSKLTLARHMMIKLKNQKNYHSLEDIQELFTQLYDLRSNIIHGRQIAKISKKNTADYINFLYPTIRLILELQYSDPAFLSFIKKI